ncbi:MAG: DUF1844 domain-containing protein [Candidatus Aureabacteria bacterium]|nr:DUF1844 domain-containing protein [Candidatus Auribacterota bacterium]MCK5160504.1 DUF1844 domain-containing protein [Candidatus Auribacterota bacterium]
MAGEKKDRVKELQFLGLITMLANSAMQGLGKISDPFTGKAERNMEAAKASIDILEVLREKTQGNLTENEEKTFDTLLTNIRLNYVDESKKPEKKEEKQEKKTETEAKEEKQPQKDKKD